MVLPAKQTDISCVYSLRPQANHIFWMYPKKPVAVKSGERRSQFKSAFLGGDRGNFDFSELITCTSYNVLLEPIILQVISLSKALKKSMIMNRYRSAFTVTL